jgi:Protein of unknown function (DUF2442)
MNSLRSKPVHAARAWAANRTLFVELDDGRVVGLPARQVENLAPLTDDQLARVEIVSHPNGDALRWHFDPTDEYAVTSISVWDLVEGAPRAVRAWAEGRTVLVELRDGRVVGFPAERFERLRSVSDDALARVEVQADGYGLRWDDPIDEDISVPGIVAASHGAQSS